MNEPSEARREEEPPLLFPAVYRDHVRAVRNALYRLAGPADLDDLAQEVFVRVHRGLPRFDGRSSLKTWIYAIVTRVAIDHHRKRRRTLADPADTEALPSASDEAAAHVRRDLVRRGLAALTFDHRLVLVLHVLEGLSLEEIAVAADVPVGTVKSRLHYARQSMSEFLERKGVKG
jgi:RNA polymerase sigma-70 factor (ECF subfamily)